MLTRSAFAIGSFIAGSLFAYCGWVAVSLNLSPDGIPLGLGMLFTGGAIAFFGPICSFLR